MISHPLGREFVSRLKAADETIVPHDLPERDTLEKMVQVGWKERKGGGWRERSEGRGGGRGGVLVSCVAVVLLTPASLHFLDGARRVFTDQANFTCTKRKAP